MDNLGLSLSDSLFFLNNEKQYLFQGMCYHPTMSSFTVSTTQVLAKATNAAVLKEWSGLGYNRLDRLKTVITTLEKDQMVTVNGRTVAIKL